MCTKLDESAHFIFLVWERFLLRQNIHEIEQKLRQQIFVHITIGERNPFIFLRNSFEKNWMKSTRDILQGSFQAELWISSSLPALATELEIVVRAPKSKFRLHDCNEKLNQSTRIPCWYTFPFATPFNCRTICIVWKISDKLFPNEETFHSSFFSISET